MKAYRICNKCGVKKRETDFPVRSDNGKKRKCCRACLYGGKIRRTHDNLNNLITAKLKDARNRKIGFNLTSEYIKKLLEEQDNRCALTGRVIGHAQENALSMDRIDSSKGYVVGNIQLVCKQANFAKHALSQQDFIQLCKEVVANSGFLIYPTRIIS
jgi:hypothetical protein